MREWISAVQKDSKKVKETFEFNCLESEKELYYCSAKSWVVSETSKPISQLSNVIFFSYRLQINLIGKMNHQPSLSIVYFNLSVKIFHVILDYFKTLQCLWYKVKITLSCVYFTGYKYMSFSLLYISTSLDITNLKKINLRDFVK